LKTKGIPGKHVGTSEDLNVPTSKKPNTPTPPAKTRTSTFKGKDPQGKDVNNVVVSDKQ
jgi:hypothetical protein